MPLHGTFGVGLRVKPSDNSSVIKDFPCFAPKQHSASFFAIAWSVAKSVDGRRKLGSGAVGADVSTAGSRGFLFETELGIFASRPTG